MKCKFCWTFGYNSLLLLLFISNGSYFVAVFATFTLDFFSLCANVVLFAKLIFKNDSPYAPIPACAPIQILRVHICYIDHTASKYHQNSELHSVDFLGRSIFQHLEYENAALLNELVYYCKNSTAAPLRGGLLQQQDGSISGN